MGGMACTNIGQSLPSGTGLIMVRGGGGADALETKKAVWHDKLLMTHAGQYHMPSRLLFTRALSLHTHAHCKGPSGVCSARHAQSYRALGHDGSHWIGCDCTWHKLAGGRVVGVRPWKVDPLRVPKLVAHEVEVALASQHGRNQADHLVQRHASAGVAGWTVDRHALVHVLVHEPEGDGLVPHERLQHHTTS